MTTTIRGTDNSAAAPALTGNDSDTGIYFPADNTVGLVTGGSERVRVTSAGAVAIGSTTAINDAVGSLQLSGTGSGTTSGGGMLNFLRPETDGVGNGDNLGSILFFGADATDNIPKQFASIRAQASGTHSAGDNPTALVFSTTPDGSETVAEVARFTESKYLRMASGSGGIQFNGDTAAANALDDYEEGTFTPELADATTGGNTATGTSFLGVYTKIGRLVTVVITFGNINTSGMTSGNTLYFRNLPFTAAADTFFSVFVDRINFTNYVIGFMGNTTTYGGFNDMIDSASDVALTVASITASGGSDIYFTFTYQVV